MCVKFKSAQRRLDDNDTAHSLHILLKLKFVSLFMRLQSTDSIFLTLNQNCTDSLDRSISPDQVES